MSSQFYQLSANQYTLILQVYNDIFFIFTDWYGSEHLQKHTYIIIVYVAHMHITCAYVIKCVISMENIFAEKRAYKSQLIAVTQSAIEISNVWFGQEWVHNESVLYNITDWLLYIGEIC